MPRFHFDVHVQDRDARPDPLGVELPDLSSARIEALRRASDIVQDATARADFGEEWRMVVTDDAGLPLFTMEFTMPNGPWSGKPSLRH